MSQNVILLSEIAAQLDMLEIRRGRLRIDCLLAQHGADVSMPAAHTCPGC